MRNKKKGFTLVELLIVIGILAVLGTTVVLVLNPAEILRSTRDSTRIDDLAKLHTALGLYVTDVSSPDLNGSQADSECTTDTSATAGDGYVAVDPTTASFNSRGSINDGTDATTEVDGNGWLPVNFTGISSGAPIAVLPVDPTNSGDLVYRYACDATNLTYELNASLESVKFKTNEDIDGTDGGDDANFYEIGTEPGLDL